MTRDLCTLAVTVALVLAGIELARSFFAWVGRIICASGHDDLSIHLATKVPEEQVARLRASAPKRYTPRKSR